MRAKNDKDYFLNWREKIWDVVGLDNDKQERENEANFRWSKRLHSRLKWDKILAVKNGPKEDDCFKE